MPWLGFEPMPSRERFVKKAYLNKYQLTDRYFYEL